MNWNSPEKVDPIKFCDPDGRIGKGFNAGSTERGRIRESNIALDRRTPLPSSVTAGYPQSLPFQVGLNVGRMHAGGGDIALAVFPVGRVIKAVDSGIKMALAAIKAANAGKQSPESLSNSGVQSGNNLDKIADNVLKWIGPKSRMSKPAGGSDLILRSADNTRQIRFDITNPHGYQPHVNVETFKPRNLYPGDRNMVEVSNEHVFPKID